MKNGALAGFFRPAAYSNDNNNNNNKKSGVF
jgi:hypothetical protein